MKFDDYDDLAPVRGILLGVLIGAVMWGAIIGAIYYFVN
jgi:hypothetical protein